MLALILTHQWPTYLHTPDTALRSSRVLGMYPPRTRQVSTIVTPAFRGISQLVPGHTACG